MKICLPSESGNILNSISPEIESFIAELEVNLVSIREFSSSIESEKQN